MRTVGESSYDSLQTKFRRRMHDGLEFLVSYTLSDAKTNAGDSLSGGGVGGLRGPDLAGWDLEERHRALRFPHEACVGVQRELRRARTRSDSERLAHQLGAVHLQRAGADDQLRGCDRSRGQAAMRSWSAIRTPAATT